MKPLLYTCVLLAFVSNVCTQVYDQDYPIVNEDDIVGEPQVLAAQPDAISPQRIEYPVFIGCLKTYGDEVVTLDETKKLFSECGSSNNLKCLNSKGTLYKYCALFSYYIDYTQDTMSNNFNDNKDPCFDCLFSTDQLSTKQQELLFNAYFRSIFFCKEAYSCLLEIFSDVGLARFNDCWLKWFGGPCETRGGMCVSNKKLCGKKYSKAVGCGDNFCCGVEFNQKCKCHFNGLSESGNVSLSVTDWCAPWQNCVKRFNKYLQVQ